MPGIFYTISKKDPFVPSAPGVLKFEVMFRKIAQFFLWKHVRVTTWVSGSILIIAIVYGIGSNYFHLKTLLHLSNKANDIIGSILIILGILAFFVFILGYLLLRRRRLDDSLDKPGQNG